MKEMSNFLKAHISGMAGAIYCKSDMYSLLVGCHIHSKFSLVWTRDHGTKKVLKIVVLCSSF